MSHPTNALDQLKTLIATGTYGTALPACFGFVLMHGPAIVELIEATDRIVARHLRGELDYGDLSTLIPALVKLSKSTTPPHIDDFGATTA